MRTGIFFINITHVGAKHALLRYFFAFSRNERPRQAPLRLRSPSHLLRCRLGGLPAVPLPAIKDLFYPILPGRSQARLAPAFVGCRKPRIHTGLFAFRDTLLPAILQEGDVFQSWGGYRF